MLLLLSYCAFVANGQAPAKEVMRVTTDITGASTCAAGRIYYNATSLVNWERNNAGVCAVIAAGGTPITGSGAAGQVTLWNSASALTGNANLTYASNVLGNRGANVATPGDARNSALFLSTTTALAADVGAMIALGGETGGVTSPYAFGTIAARKTNNTSGNFLGYLSFATSDAVSNLTEQLRISGAGVLTLGTQPAASAAADSTVCVSTTGVITKSNAACVAASSRLYKHGFAPLNHGLDWLMRMPTRNMTWTWNKDMGGRANLPSIGPIAEDMAAIDLRLAFKDGNVLGINDRAILAVVIKSVQEQQQQIATLTAKVAAQQRTIRRLQRHQN